MEVVLRKTDSFNLYNNPAAFGIPTATGSSHWDGTSGNTRPTTGSSNPSDGYGTVPPGRDYHDIEVSLHHSHHHTTTDQVLPGLLTFRTNQKM